MRQLRHAIIATALLTGFSGTAGAQSGRGSGADIAAIKKTGAEFSQLYMKGDNEAMARIYTEDGVIFPPGRPMISGRKAIAEYWKLGQGVTVVEHQTVADSIIIRGDIAYDYGTFRARNARDGQPGNPGFGKYVIVWRKTGGQWLMHLDIWNNSPAPATPP
jgi:ketosteroid isomerase-like protein